MKRLLLIAAISLMTISTSGCWQRYQTGYRGGWFWNRYRPNVYETYYNHGNCCNECGTEIHSSPENCSSCGSTITVPSTAAPLTMPPPVLPGPVTP